MRTAAFFCKLENRNRFCRDDAHLITILHIHLWVVIPHKAYDMPTSMTVSSNINFLSHFWVYLLTFCIKINDLKRTLQQLLCHEVNKSKIHSNSGLLPFVL